MSALLKVRKNILKTTFGLTLANKKFSLKNFTQFILSIIEKAVIIIPLVSSVMPSIFYAPTSIDLMESPSF